MRYQKIISIFVLLLTMLFYTGCGRVTAAKNTSDKTEEVIIEALAVTAIGPYFEGADYMAGSMVTFSANVSAPESIGELSYTWDFGDGTTKNIVTTNRNAEITHNYSYSGIFYYSLNIEDKNNRRIKPLYFMAPSPISANGRERPDIIGLTVPASANTTEAVSFICEVNTDGSIYTYDWDFGDGNTGNGPAQSHQYATPGLKTVLVTVNNTSNNTHSFRKRYIYISDTPISWSEAPIIDDFSFKVIDNDPVAPDRLGLYTPCTVQFIVNAKDYDNNDIALDRYSWSIRPEVGSGAIYNEDNILDSHTFNATGNYTISVKVRNNLGTKIAERVQKITIHEYVAN